MVETGVRSKKEGGRPDGPADRRDSLLPRNARRRYDLASETAMYTSVWLRSW